MLVSPIISPIVLASKIWDDSSCIAYFDFSEGRLDRSSKGNHGVITGGAWTANGFVPGTSGYIKLAQSIFDDLAQFTCITVFNVASLGGASAGNIFNKAQRYHSMALSTGNKLYYAQTRGTGADTWRCETTFNLNTPCICGVAYSNAQADTGPTMWVGSTKGTITRIATGSGIVASDASSDLYISNNNTATRNLDGPIYIQAWWNRVFTNADYLEKLDLLRPIMASKGAFI